MKLEKLIDIFEQKYPRCNSEDWDNVGLLIGGKSKEINKVQISLDISKNVVKHAIENNVDLIVTHHPMIFNGLKKINYNNVTGQNIIDLITNNISVYTMHTNLDSSSDGLNELIVKKLGIKSSEIIDPIHEERTKMEFSVPELIGEKIEKEILGTFIINYEDCLNVEKQKIDRLDIEENNEIPMTKYSVVGRRNIIDNLRKKIKDYYEYICFEIAEIKNLKGVESGIGRFFVLDEKVMLSDFASLVKEKLGLKRIRACYSEDKKVKRIGIINGSGMSMIRKMRGKNIDVFITGDVKYHEAMENVENGVSIFDIGHYESEVFFSELIVELIKDKTEIIVYNNEPIFKYL